MTERYRILHETEYEYSAPVSLAQHILHLTPRVCAWQRLAAATLAIDPEPARRRDGLDAFANPVTRIGIEAPHRRLHVGSDFQVEVGPRPWAESFADIAIDRPWDTVRAWLDFGGGSPLDPLRFRHQSPYVRVKSELTAYGASSFAAGRPLLDAAIDLMARIHADFRFDSEATEVGTSVLELLATRRGVCQDFAHFMIGALRARGLAARYISGYLLTEPPAGQARLVGADASHAWVALHFPAADDDSDGTWIEFDPTNNCLADQRHVVVAWGRDFGDVSPLRGVIQGGGDHHLKVRVTVRPLDDETGDEA